MEKRPKALTVLLRTERKTLVKIELFHAREWDAEALGYRIRRDGAWVCEQGKRTFYTVSALTKFLLRLVAHCLGDEVGVETHEPQIRPGTFVRVKRYDEKLSVEHLVTAKIMGPPIRAIDGKWYVLVDVPYDGKTYVEVKP